MRRVAAADLSSKELKAELDRLEIDHRHCIEKSELIHLVEQVRADPDLAKQETKEWTKYADHVEESIYEYQLLVFPGPCPFFGGSIVSGSL